MADIRFLDYTEEVKGRIAQLAPAVLEEVAGEVESQTKQNTAVRTGQTKNSWTHRVEQDSNMYTATVGSPMQNAVWEEYGTGEYALNGNGRKGGWYYVDEEGKGHFTHGKRPRRPCFKAYSTLKNKMIQHMRDRFKGGLS